MADIAVILAFHNEERYLPEALALLEQQEDADWHLYLIDDGSTDDSPKIAEEWADRNEHRCTHVRRVRNAGKAACVAMAEPMLRERYITFLDADDRLEGHALALCKAALDSEPGANVVVSGSRLIDEDGKFIRDWRWNADSYSRRSLRAGRVSPGLMMLRAEAYKAAGGIDIAFTRGHMYELRLRMAKRGPFLLIPDVLYSYRVHGGQVSVRKREEQAEYIVKARQKHKDVK